MERAVLIALQRLVNDATDQQIEQRLKEWGTKIETLSTLENAKATAETALTTEKTEHEAARQKICALENQVNTPSGARITILLDNAIANGRITPAQRTTWQVDLATQTKQITVQVNDHIKFCGLQSIFH